MKHQTDPICTRDDSVGGRLPRPAPVEAAWQEVIDGLVRYLVCHARLFEPTADAAFDLNGAYGIRYNDEYVNIGYVFLALQVTEHSANPYFGQEDAVAMYVRAVEAGLDKWTAEYRSAGATPPDEWAPFVMCRGLELLADRLAAGLRQRIRDSLVVFVEEYIRRPFFFTAPNHEIWKLVDIAAAGRVLERPDWIRHAEFQAGQLVAYQTGEGFWEEGRHHGPSLQYSSHMLPGLALLARETGSAAIHAAAARQARFLIDWSFPDGVSVGAFDGRRCTALGAVAPGMELVPEGLSYMRRTVASWEQSGWLDLARRAAPIYRRPFKGDFIAAEALRYFSDASHRPSAAAAAPLPLDNDGATLENHSARFDALFARRGAWAVALSSQLSDVPKDTGFIYRLERQSRIELWHRRASVVVGGGHSLLTAEYPLYNAWVDSGYQGADPPRYRYYPRAAASGAQGAVCWLELTFAHATVRFEVEADGEDLDVRYSYSALGARELRVALPMMLWEGARLLVDGQPLERTPERRSREVRCEVAVDCPLYGVRNVLSVPRAVATRVQYPLPLMENYHPLLPGEPLHSVFALALVETVLPEPVASGAGAWRLHVARTGK